MQTVDRDRASLDARGKVDPRLGLVKPTFQEPAWGPHVSIVRGERVRDHLDVWDLGVELGDVLEEIISMVESRKHYEAKAAEFSAQVAAMGPGVRPKYRAAQEASLTDMQTKVADRTRRLARLERDEARLVARWKALGLPDYLTPGGKVQFGFDPDIKLARTHWYLDVKCRTLGRVREFYGLPARLPVRPHLTVGVTGG
jgi:hypothetical protein